MHDDSRPTADEVMAAAAREFLAATRLTLDGFDRLGTELAARPDAEEELTPFRRELHRLNGSAATFGFPRAGRMAAAMEALVRKWIEAPGLDGDRRVTVVASFATAIRAQFTVGVDGADAPRAPGRRLLVVGARDAVAASLTAEAAARGYLVERVAAGDVDEALEDGAPFAMIAMAPSPSHDLLKGTVAIELHLDGKAAAAHTATAAESPAAGFAAAMPGSGAPHRLSADAGAATILDAVDALASAQRDASGTVLVLDDDPVMRTVVGVAAAQVNLVAAAVADPAAFRSALKRFAPAVIVVDVEIGDTNGLDLVREVRAQPAYAAVPIVVLSGHRDDETRRAAFDAGAADYLLKPVSLPVLAAKLAAWHARGAR